MRITKLFILALSGMFVLTSVAMAGSGEACIAKKAGAKTAVISVSGMTCGGCASQVKAALASVEGVKVCDVDWKEGKATVEYSGDEKVTNQLLSAVNKTAFKASLACDVADAKVKAMSVSAKAISTFTSFDCEHCGYSQAKAGNCPTCNAKLSSVEKQHTYACTMCSYTSAKAGNCKTCGMKLAEYNVAYQCGGCEKVGAAADLCKGCEKDALTVLGAPMNKSGDKKADATEKVM
ncbi:MAG: cation transporter [candidate division Zixibacteria bacterium]|nr:cation transporter [candidate division Zixibacteria bacterium]